MPNKKKMTIREIAKLSGVSPTAVSFVLNNREGVSEATRQKVSRVIEMTNFIPNASSRRLTTKKNYNIALIYPPSASPFTDYFYNEIADGLTAFFTQAGYNVVLVPEDTKDPGALPHIVRRQDADGAVFFQSAAPLLLDSLSEMKFPFVMIDLHDKVEKYVHVSLDCAEFIYRAVKYLHQKGHTRIAFLGSERLPNYYINCFSGYQRAFSEFALPLQADWIQNQAVDSATTAACVENLYNSPQRPTALCCMSDMLAIYAVNAAKTIGWHVPKELSVISIDDIVLSRHTDPQITAISYDKKQMGELGGQLLLRSINGEKSKTHIIREYTIAERQSVAPPPR